ncbi:hypothetical protein [Mesorhizobium sp. WSM4906]|uniref:hypothetical protein n=1 Tax=Mesorhizobium sp. WSM4906 TaxID=3038546 RepID=UPI0024165594|nr:hypothetical protein [Mesorhizobium sp. WSM4906]WFP76178.1 hypothetical protein QAZ22_31665 [Mesorhizobium sp. WSM4906]
MKSAIGPIRANAFRITEWTQVYIQAKFPPAKATVLVDPSGTEWIMDLRGRGEVIAPVWHCTTDAAARYPFAPMRCQSRDDAGLSA